MSNENMEQVMKAQEHDISDINEEVIVEGSKAIGEEAAKGFKKIEDAVVSGYKKIEEGVVTGYKKIETGVVEGFNKVTDKCVEVLFAKEGETVEEAKARLSGEKITEKADEESSNG